MYHDPINNLWAVGKFYNKLCIFLRSKLTLIFVLANKLIHAGKGLQCGIESILPNLLKFAQEKHNL